MLAQAVKSATEVSPVTGEEVALADDSPCVRVRVHVCVSACAVWTYVCAHTTASALPRSTTVDGLHNSHRFLAGIQLTLQSGDARLLVFADVHNDVHNNDDAVDLI